MSTDASWMVVTIPTKKYEEQLFRQKQKERELEQSNSSTNRNNNTISAADQKKDNFVSLEKHLTDILEKLKVDNIAWVPTREGKYYQVYFPCDNYENDATMMAIRSKGIGVKPFTSVGFIPFGIFYYDDIGGDDDDDDYGMPGEFISSENFYSMRNEKKKKEGYFAREAKDFVTSVKARLTVAQVVQGVRNGAEVNFDWLCYTILAGWICCNGICNDQDVDIAASMMIEPIMGTVVAMCFGLVIHDRSLFTLGVRSLLISIAICLVQGFIYGLIFFTWRFAWNPGDGTWPTVEMSERGVFRQLIYGALIAIPGGGLIAVTLLNDNKPSFVGVATATTFLPPAMNCGLLWALVCHIQWDGFGQELQAYNISGEINYLRQAWAPMSTYTPTYSNDMRVECTILGLVSLLYTVENVVCLGVCCYLMLRIKEIVPLNKLPSGSQKFFKQDIRITRDYNRRATQGGIYDNQETLGKQILREWAMIAGIDPVKLLSDQPEAKVTRLQTLLDLAREIEADAEYQQVMHDAVGQPGYNGALLRRLTQPHLSRNGSQRRRDSAYEVNSPGTVPSYVNYGYQMNEMGRNNNDQMTISSISAGLPSYSTIQRGYRPGELIDKSNLRRTSAVLRKSLRDSRRSKYSIWPVNLDARTDGIEDVRDQGQEGRRKVGEDGKDVSVEAMREAVRRRKNSNLV